MQRNGFAHIGQGLRYRFSAGDAPGKVRDVCGVVGADVFNDHGGEIVACLSRDCHSARLVRAFVLPVTARDALRIDGVRTLSSTHARPNQRASKRVTSVISLSSSLPMVAPILAVATVTILSTITCDDV